MPTSTAARAEAPRPSRGRATRHSLVVLARDVADAVGGAGGLLFDRASCGWRVEVHLAEPDHGDALRILGVPHVTLSEGLAESNTWPDVIVVSAELHRDHDGVRDLFAVASRRVLTEVALWGGDWPDDAGSQLGRVEHRLSTAASAFKPHAMAAAGLTPRVDEVEEFLSGQRRFAIAAPLTPFD